MKIKALVALALVALLGGVGFLYSGLYPIGADVPHFKLTYWALETLRDSSVARASKDIEVPDLSNPQLLLAGGADYNDMCAACHLKPGKTKSDMSQGLYPAPPNLAGSGAAGHDHDAGEGLAQRAQRQFWTIKHGIKASAMPAWGKTHDDKRIWAMVAFLQKLPDLNPVQYQIITARRSSDAGHGGSREN